MIIPSCKNAIDWFKLNKTIVNPEKFQAALTYRSAAKC